MGAITANCDNFIDPIVEEEEPVFNENEISGKFKMVRKTLVIVTTFMSKVSEWKASLSDPESPEFEALANTIEGSLKEMLLRCCFA